MVVELLVGDVKGIVGDMLDDEFFQPGKLLQRLHGFSGSPAHVLQVGGDVLGVGENAFLSHSVDGGNHVAFAHGQDVGKVVDARLGLGILCLGDALLGNQRSDDAYGFLRLVFGEKGRFRDAFSGFVRIPHGDARGIDMGNVVASFDISALFQCCKGCAYTGFDGGYGIVPSCLPGYLQGRTTYVGTLFGEVFNGFPNLLYLTDAQFGLVEEDEMFVEVVVAVEYEAAGVQMRVSSGTSCLLHIVLQRVGDVVMHYQAHIALIYSHAEGRGGYDDAHLVVHERLLVLYLFVGIHLAVIGQCLHAVAGEFGGKLTGALGSGNIDDGGSVGGLYERTEPAVLLFVGIHMDNGVVEIGARG